MEHLQHFGLARDPFSNDPQIQAYFEGATHKAAERRLDRAVAQNRGLVLFTGPSGAGKTMVVRHLFEELEEDVFEACLLVPTPGLADDHWVLQRLAAQLGVDEPADDRGALLAQVYEQMAIVREDGRHTVLIVDDAEVLEEQGALGAVRALLNLEYEERRLVTLILVGGPDLEDAVARIRGLGDRVDVAVRIARLPIAEANEYLVHRIRRVGGSPAIIEPAAMPALVDAADALPRRMNCIADNALYEAYLDGRVAANVADMSRAATDLALGAGLDRAPQTVNAPAPPPPVEAERAAPAPAATAPVDSMFDEPAGAPEATMVMAAPAPAPTPEVLAAPTPPPFSGGAPDATRVFTIDEPAAAPLPPAGNAGAPDQTRILSADEAGAEELLATFDEPSAIPTDGPPKDDEIDDLFVDLVEEI